MSRLEASKGLEVGEDSDQIVFLWPLYVHLSPESTAFLTGILFKSNAQLRQLSLSQNVECSLNKYGHLC